MHRVGGSTRDTVQKAIAGLLPNGHPTLQLTARKLGLSARSLQRRLGELGTTHSELVTKVRFEMACRLLAETNDRISNIATDLGFADASSFSRAFLRWSQMQPRLYRQQQAEQKRSERLPQPGRE